MRLRWLALFGGCVILGVVAAKGNEGNPRQPPSPAPAVGTAAQAWVALPVPGGDTGTGDAGAALRPGDAEEAPGGEADPFAAAAAPHHVHTVQRGDTLSGIFDVAGFSAGELQLLMRLDDAPLSMLFPGQRLEFFAGDDGALARLVMHQSETHYAAFTRAGAAFRWQQHETPTETRLSYAHGVIRDSLFTAGRRAGISDRLIMELAHIFGWDIDFALDVRRGDQFTVVYETIYQNGEPLREGTILAAEFVNQKQAYRAVRYTRADGRSDYFTPAGHSMRKAFLRSPLNFTRISSRFDRKRKHPVLHRVRAHKGVDYAAPRGTPVWSTGEGKIVFRGAKGGYGKTLIVQHGTRYSTLYAHLRGYARGLGNGTRVRQGQVIGYVGSTGLATGPHLHYEFRVNGTHRDPLRVSLPKAQPLPDDELPDFRQHTAELWHQLDVLERTQLALADGDAPH